MQKTDFQLDMTMMVATHDALRRDLDHAAGRTTRCDGWDLFARILHAHHTAEDDALWPVVRGEVADRPDDLALLDTMTAEHAELSPVLAGIDEAFGEEGSGARAGKLIGELDAGLRQHLDHEERDALPVIDRALTFEQWMGFGEAARKALGPDVPLYFPWLLDGADDETVERVFRLMPEPLKALYRNEWLPAYQAHDRWET
jgi:hypothetical protein